MKTAAELCLVWVASGLAAGALTAVFFFCAVMWAARNYDRADRPRISKFSNFPKP